MASKKKYERYKKSTLVGKARKRGYANPQQYTKKQLIRKLRS
jgi:hypothetical protein